ncbi:MAG: hypothetical protein R3292_01260 [Alcanivorax sp.]|nr:hypothetical protein [Alcanivorax sp.]
MRLTAFALLLIASLAAAPPATAEATDTTAAATKSVAQRELDVKHWLLLFPVAAAGITVGLIIWTRRRK